MPLLPIPASADDWHALRARHVGASEVAILFGAAPPYAPGPYALWQVKARRIPREDVNHQRAAWGLRLEEAIAAAAAEQEGWDVRPGVYASRDGLGATLDRLIAAPGQNDEGCEGPGVLELKNVDWLVHRRSWGDEPPLHILLQFQAQLLATGYTWGRVAALVSGNDLHIYRYTARPKVQTEITRRVADFWRSIEADRPPPPDGTGATSRALMALFPEVDDAPADLTEDNEAPILCADYLRAAAAEREAKAAKDEARNRLLEKLGAYRWAQVAGFRLSQAITPGKPAVEVTPEMVGTMLPGRAESRRLIVTERKG